MRLNRNRAATASRPGICGGVTLLSPGWNRICYGAGMRIPILALVALISAHAAEPLPRADVVARLRPSISNLLTTIEQATELEVQFKRLPTNAHVEAQFIYSENEARVELRDGWTDDDVAHELLHLKMQFVDRYSVPGLRRGVKRTPGSERAESRLRSVVDDHIIHRTLVGLGLKADGEVLQKPLFDDICVVVPKRLREGAGPAGDGLSHMDADGFGDVMRVTTLVQVELCLRDLGSALPPNRVERLRDFSAAFREHRPRESAIADQVLGWFTEFDVMTMAGQEKILWNWMKLAGLDQFAGPTRFERREGRWILPWP